MAAYWGQRAFWGAKWLSENKESFYREKETQYYTAEEQQLTQVQVTY